MLLRIALAALTLALLAGPASAGQSLIPTPYPSAVGGGQPLNPEAPDPSGPQTLMRDPYPQATGKESQGNPIVRTHGRHQHLVPSTNQRKFRVDRQ